MADTTNRQEGVQTMWFGPTGDPRSFNESSLPYPGLLGKTCRYNGKVYQLVQLSSGATPPSATNGTVAFWKDKTAYTISTKLADSSRSEVAGIFDNSVTITEGNYCFVMKRGQHTAVKSLGTSARGDVAAANTGTGQDVVTLTFAANANAIKGIGVYQGNMANNVATVNLEIWD